MTLEFTNYVERQDRTRAVQFLDPSTAAAVAAFVRPGAKWRLDFDTEAEFSLVVGDVTVKYGDYIATRNGWSFDSVISWPEFLRTWERDTD